MNIDGVDMCDGIKLIRISDDQNDTRILEKEVFLASNPKSQTYSEKESDVKPHPVKPRNRNHNKPVRENLQKLWENGGPVKLYSISQDGGYSIIINNFSHLRYEDLKKLFLPFGQFMAMRELDNNFVRVTFRTEDEIRKCYEALKMDRRYKVRVVLDEDEFFERKKQIVAQRMWYGEPINKSMMMEATYIDNESRKDETEKIYKNILKQEEKIGFNLSKPLQKPCPKPQVMKRGGSSKLLGFYKGHRVVEDDEPIINKYLQPPPPSYSMQTTVKEVNDPHCRPERGHPPVEVLYNTLFDQRSRNVKKYANQFRRDFSSSKKGSHC